MDRINAEEKKLKNDLDVFIKEECAIKNKIEYINEELKKCIDKKLDYGDWVNEHCKLFKYLPGRLPPKERHYKYLDEANPQYDIYREIGVPNSIIELSEEISGIDSASELMVYDSDEFTDDDDKSVNLNNGNVNWSQRQIVSKMGLVFEIDDVNIQNEKWLKEYGPSVLYEPCADDEKDIYKLHRRPNSNVYEHVSNILVNCDDGEKKYVNDAINIDYDGDDENDFYTFTIRAEDKLKLLNEQKYFEPLLYYTCLNYKSSLFVISKYIKKNVNEHKKNQ